MNKTPKEKSVPNLDSSKAKGKRENQKHSDEVQSSR